jgi:hypothetical protein
VKAKARQIITEAKGWVPDYARNNAELWTPKLVRDVLVDAFRMLNKTGGRVGPARVKAHWPEFQSFDLGDVVNEEQRRKAEQRSTEYRTRMNVTRMEMVLLGSNGMPPWMELVREAPDLQKTLRIFIGAELRGDSAKELCISHGWIYTTALTHRDRAAGIIAQRLNCSGVDPW